MYALRQPSSFEFGKYGAVVFPSHEDAFNYELLNSLGDHEAQLRRVCERHVRQALIAVTVGNSVIPPNIMIHGEHHVLAFIEEFIEEIGVMTPIGSFPWRRQPRPALPARGDQARRRVDLLGGVAPFGAQEPRPPVDGQL